MAEIRVNEQELERMIVVLEQASRELEECQRHMQQIAKKMENGALVGVGGEAFATGLNNNMSSSIMRLSEKLREEAKYVQNELTQFRAAQQRNRGLFS
jgi:prefoldin subunit 5